MMRVCNENRLILLFDGMKRMAWRLDNQAELLDIVKNEEYGPKLVQILGLGAGVGEDRQACCPLWSWKTLRDQWTVLR